MSTCLRRPRHNLIILAGGRSRRMGQLKPHLLINNKRLIDIVASRIASLFSRVIVVSKKGMPPIENYDVVYDDYDEYSPLLGILVGLKYSESLVNFIIACDMPFVQPELVQFLLRMAEDRDADVVVPVNNGFYEPLCAVYSKRCIPFIEEEISQGNLKVTSFYPKVNTVSVPEYLLRQYDASLWSFFNINTKEDLKKALQFID
ncbi:MAG: molybdenum cofactor guanylyltransferase [candidate division WOR-3 bacterium]